MGTTEILKQDLIIEDNTKPRKEIPVELKDTKNFDGKIPEIIVT